MPDGQLNPVKIKIARRKEVAPGVVNYELVVTPGTSSVRRPKIDKAFAELFVRRLHHNSSKIPGYARATE